MISLEPHFDTIFIIGGVIGSFIKIVFENDGEFKLPTVYKQTINGAEKRLLSVGFLGNVFVGVMVAVYADHSLLVSILAAIAGPYLLEQAFRIYQGFKEGKIELIK